MASISEIIEVYRLRKFAEAEAAAKLPGPPREPHPKIISAVSEQDAMYDQFDFVMEAGPSDSRYQAIRPILLAAFEEAKRAVRGA